MKVIIAFFALVTVALTAPANPEASAKTLLEDSENNGIDGYHYHIETSNGIRSEETGSFGKAGNEDLHATGYFKYFGPDGVEYIVDYTADTDGFHPNGVHLPTRSRKCIFGCDN